MTDDNFDTGLFDNINTSLNLGDKNTPNNQFLINKMFKQ